MTDEKARESLKKLDDKRNLIGVGGYKDSRRMRSEQHEKFNTTMKEMTEESDERKIKEAEENE